MTFEAFVLYYGMVERFSCLFYLDKGATKGSFLFRTLVLTELKQEEKMKLLGFLIFLAAFPVGGYLLSTNNNLASSNTINPQSMSAAVVWIVMVLAGYIMMSREERNA